MRVLALILLVLIAHSAQAMNEWHDPPTAPWYQRTIPKNGGLVGHEDASGRFGCLFTGSEISAGTDALMCFDKERRGASIWLVGMKPADCATENNVTQCAFAIGDTTAHLPLVHGAEHVWGLEEKGDKALYNLVERTGYYYTISINTDKGDKTFSFTIPNEYRD